MTVAYAFVGKLMLIFGGDRYSDITRITQHFRLRFALNNLRYQLISKHKLLIWHSLAMNEVYFWLAIIHLPKSNGQAITHFIIEQFLLV
jgi:hypothetical protein